MDQKPGKKAENKDEYDVDIQSCSAMDCTGLIPSLPQSFAEVEHYNDLYQFLPEHVSDQEELLSHCPTRNRRRPLACIPGPLPDQKSCPRQPPGSGRIYIK